MNSIDWLKSHVNRRGFVCDQFTDTNKCKKDLKPTVIVLQYLDQGPSNFHNEFRTTGIGRDCVRVIAEYADFLMDARFEKERDLVDFLVDYFKGISEHDRQAVLDQFIKVLVLGAKWGLQHGGLDPEEAHWLQALREHVPVTPSRVVLDYVGHLTEPDAVCDAIDKLKGLPFREEVITDILYSLLTNGVDQLMTLGEELFESMVRAEHRLGKREPHELAQHLSVLRRGFHLLRQSFQQGSSRVATLLGSQLFKADTLERRQKAASQTLQMDQLTELPLGNMSLELAMAHNYGTKQVKELWAKMPTLPVPKRFDSLNDLADRFEEAYGCRSAAAFGIVALELQKLCFLFNRPKHLLQEITPSAIKIFLLIYGGREKCEGAPFKKEEAMMQALVKKQNELRRPIRERFQSARDQVEKLTKQEHALLEKLNESEKPEKKARAELEKQKKCVLLPATVSTAPNRDQVEALLESDSDLRALITVATGTELEGFRAWVSKMSKEGNFETCDLLYAETIQTVIRHHNLRALSKLQTELRKPIGEQDLDETLKMSLLNCTNEKEFLGHDSAGFEKLLSDEEINAYLSQQCLGLLKGANADLITYVERTLRRIIKRSSSETVVKVGKRFIITLPLHRQVHIPASLNDPKILKAHEQTIHDALMAEWQRTLQPVQEPSERLTKFRDRELSPSIQRLKDLEGLLNDPWSLVLLPEGTKRTLSPKEVDGVILQDPLLRQIRAEFVNREASLQLIEVLSQNTQIPKELRSKYLSKIEELDDNELMEYRKREPSFNKLYLHALAIVEERFRNTYCQLVPLSHENRVAVKMPTVIKFDPAPIRFHDILKAIGFKKPLDFFATGFDINPMDIDVTNPAIHVGLEPFRKLFLQSDFEEVRKYFAVTIATFLKASYRGLIKEKGAPFAKEEMRPIFDFFNDFRLTLLRTLVLGIKEYELSVWHPIDGKKSHFHKPFNNIFLAGIIQLVAKVVGIIFENRRKLDLINLTHMLSCAAVDSIKMMTRQFTEVR